jgi:hypothetical protein
VEENNNNNNKNKNSVFFLITPCFTVFINHLLLNLLPEPSRAGKPSLFISSEASRNGEQTPYSGVYAGESRFTISDSLHRNCHRRLNLAATAYMKSKPLLVSANLRFS